MLLLLPAGTGKTHISQQITGAALRAIEIGADVLLKGTKVDGVYSDDPVYQSKGQKI